MKKLAFTLAEVLITLAVIGVIATMTLPSLQMNVQKQQIGPALAKAINSLENANHLALQQFDARTLDEIAIVNSGVTAYFDDVLTPVMKITKLSNGKPANVSYRNYNYSGLYSDANSGSGYYTSPDGMGWIRTKTSTTTALSASQISKLPNGYGGKYYGVFVDVNGFEKKPNALGRDLFLLWSDTKGTVIPYGGVAYKAYTGGSSVLWESGCKSNVSNALACAGSIVDNGYKVIYKY